MKVYKMLFANIYPLYIQKATKKGRTAEEVNEIIFWLTGYDEQKKKKIGIIFISKKKKKIKKKIEI